MRDQSYLQWPFFGEFHRDLAERVESWADNNLQSVDESDVDSACVRLVHQLAEGGVLRHAVPGGGESANDLDLRALCIIREILARFSGLADFAFAMQGLGAAPLWLHGSLELQRRYLPGIVTGRSIAAFALSEMGAGSDIASMTTAATRHHNGYVLNGEKAWISNAGIASHYVVFARYPELGEKSYLAVVVDANNPGLRVVSRTKVMAPHPLGTVRFDDCHVKREAVIGEAGRGLRVALSTLDLFRCTVGAAALGFARRALAETLVHVTSREAFGQVLAEFQLTKARVAEMATAVDTSALLIYRAAWSRDVARSRITREAAMAKLHATESAQQVVDAAVQLFGGLGVVCEHPVERLYRQVRALRIYEGTSEIQKLIIADQVLPRADKEGGIKHA
jgi:acyl-CoA dehydrogenase